MNSYTIFWILFSLNFLGFLHEGHAVIEDVAAGRGPFATHIGNIGTRSADKALDGNDNPDFNAGYCAHSYKERSTAWWMVDLGTQCAIHSVTIYSTTGTIYELLLGYVSVRVSDSADINDHKVLDQCTLWDNERFPANSSQTLDCDQVKYGRYVSIQRTAGVNTHSMVLCEVKVMGERIYDTDCSKCNGDSCSSDSPCTECKPGYQTPECIEPCDSGYYGVGCEEECSEGCEDTCNVMDGTCNCKDWWLGDRCETEVADLRPPTDRPSVPSVTDSTADIKWKKITNVPDGLSDHYQYVIEYSEGFNIDYQEWPTRHLHNPSSDQYQEDTLTGLAYDTFYRVRVRSYRILGTDEDETGVSSNIQFTTQCQTPDEPDIIEVTREQQRNRLNLIITWKAPQTYTDCRKITDIDIDYRLTSESEDDYVNLDLSPSHTSYTLSDLDPGEFVVRLTVKNNGGITNSAEETSEYNTDCNNCEDNRCTRRDPCSECEAGYQSVECRTSCDSDYYGVNCEEQCSEGCEDTCNIGTGTCSCKEWWKGSKCDTEIRALKLSIRGSVVESVTESSAVIRWEKITNVPDGLSDHYQYVIEYKEDTSNWAEWPTRHSHNPSSDEYQQDTLTGLMYGITYDVQVKSYRILEDKREETESTYDKEFITLCLEPEKPTDMNILHEDISGKVKLTITWQAAPSYSDCRRITGYGIEYRLISESEDDWRSRDLSRKDTSVILSSLEIGDYIVRLTVTNSGGRTNYTVKATGLDTDCSQCTDPGPCDTEDPCQTCKAGRKTPECRSDCDPGNFGVNCVERCSEGCEDTCDITTGTCRCRQWWDGNKCTAEIKKLGLPEVPPLVNSVTESSVIIRWRTLTNVPDELSDYYQYVIEYKEAASSNWTEWKTLKHSPSSEQDDTPAGLMFQSDDPPDQYQEATLTGLTYNTGYDVRIKSYRVVRTKEEQTGVTDNFSIKTKCTDPSEPREATVTPEKNDDPVTLTITWEEPEIIGCNEITHYNIWYRLKSAASEDWMKTNNIHSSSTSYTLIDLESGSYMFRVLVNNDEEGSNFVELSYKSGPDEGTDYIGLIVGIVITCLIIIVLAVVVAFVLHRNRKLRQENREPNTSHTLKEQSPSSEAQKESPYEDVEESNFNHGEPTPKGEPYSVSMVTAEISDVPENLYEKPSLHVYENAEDMLAGSQYETLKAT